MPWECEVRCELQLERATASSLSLRFVARVAPPGGLVTGAPTASCPSGAARALLPSASRPASRPAEMLTAGAPSGGAPPAPSFQFRLAMRTDTAEAAKYPSAGGGGGHGSGSGLEASGGDVIGDAFVEIYQGPLSTYQVDCLLPAHSYTLRLSATLIEHHPAASPPPNSSLPLPPSRPSTQQRLADAASRPPTSSLVPPSTGIGAGLATGAWSLVAEEPKAPPNKAFRRRPRMKPSEGALE